MKIRPEEVGEYPTLQAYPELRSQIENWAETKDRPSVLLYGKRRAGTSQLAQAMIRRVLLQEERPEKSRKWWPRPVVVRFTLDDLRTVTTKPWSFDKVPDADLDVAAYRRSVWDFESIENADIVWIDNVRPTDDMDFWTKFLSRPIDDRICEGMLTFVSGTEAQVLSMFDESVVEDCAWPLEVHRAEW